MKIFQWFLAALAFFRLVIILAWFSNPPADISGVLHPKHPSMLKSGSSVASAPMSKWLAYFFGLAILTVFGFCLAIGSRRNGVIGPIKNWLIIGCLLYIGIYTLAIFNYWDYVQTGRSIYLFAFPLPTAWMIYGLMFFPFFFVIIYIWKFKSWVLSPEDIERFNQIVSERRARELSQQSEDN